MQTYLISPKIDYSSPVQGMFSLFSALGCEYHKKIKFCEFSFRHGPFKSKIKNNPVFHEIYFLDLIKQRLFDSNKSELVSFCFRADLLAFFLRKKSNKWVCFVRCDIFSLYKIETRFGFLKSCLHVFLLRSADKVLVSSKFLERKFKAVGFTHVYAVGNAEFSVIPKPRPTRFGSDQFVFGYFGGDSLNKGVRLVLNAVKFFSESVPDLPVKFIIGGSFSDNDFVNEFKSFSSVDFVGYCDVREFFQKIDVLLIPSYSEGTPRLGIEALTSKLPFIYRGGIGLDEVWSNPIYANNFEFEDDVTFVKTALGVIETLTQCERPGCLICYNFTRRGHLQSVGSQLFGKFRNAG